MFNHVPFAFIPVCGGLFPAREFSNHPHFTARRGSRPAGGPENPPDGATFGRFWSPGEGSA